MKPTTARYIVGVLAVAAILAGLRVMRADPPEVSAPGAAPVLDLGHQQGTDAVINDMAKRPRP